MGVVKRYKWVLLLGLMLLLAVVFSPDFGLEAASITWLNLVFMLKILPPIFLLLGILDIWVPKETMIKYVGAGSGIRGGIIAFSLGSVAAGPLYAAFPVAQMLLKKETSLINVFIFIGAWSTTKIPLILFETSALGAGFSISRLLLNIPVIIIIAYLTHKIVHKEQAAIYQASHQL
ncbi:MAG: permease [Desulfitibacter sp. BRH_c19]|nr:MAG: permease [Desulfitibacter sp. BRH_c19]